MGYFYHMCPSWFEYSSFFQEALSLGKIEAKIWLMILAEETMLGQYVLILDTEAVNGYTAVFTTNGS